MDKIKLAEVVGMKPDDIIITGHSEEYEKGWKEGRTDAIDELDKFEIDHKEIRKCMAQGDSDYFKSIKCYEVDKLTFISEHLASNASKWIVKKG